MRWKSRFFLLAIASLAALVAQTLPPAPRFDSVTVQASPAGAREMGGYIEGGQAVFLHDTLTDIIANAWGVNPDHIVGAPDWFGRDLYDLRAKASVGATPEQMQQMLQSVLAERFALRTHAEQRPFPAFALTLAKSKPKLQPAANPDAPAVCKPPASVSTAPATGRIGQTLECTSMSMAELAQQLPQLGPAYVNHPVMDRTGLAGKYDFSLAWAARIMLHDPRDPAYDPDVDVSLFAAVGKLGLKLDPIEQPATVIVVDAVNEKPTVDPAATAATPAMPTEFDVAEIKPAPADKPQAFNFRLTPGGELDACCLSLQALVTISFQIDDRRLADVPAWLNTDRWSIQAKTVPGATELDVVPMVQNLLKSRFGLVFHNDTRVMPVYALRAGDHPRLTPTKGGRTGCTNAPGNGDRVYTCTNVTMAQFISNLEDSAGGYLDKPAVDLTGLSGAWDFTFNFAPIMRTALAPLRNPNAPPATGTTLFDALDKQLGLKLTSDKQPVAVVVIDHVNRTPTAN